MSSSDEKQKIIRVAIIGSAGRNGDAKWMTPKAWKYMLEKTKEQIEEIWKLNTRQIQLVSGGASFADHLAVEMHMYETYKGLHIYLPCEFHCDTQRFDVSHMCGKRLNDLHSTFTKKIQIGPSGKDRSESVIYSLSELEWELSSNNAKYSVYNGFMARNTAIAENCDYLIAWSTASGKEPKPNSGTWDTWSKCKLPAEKRCLLVIPPPPPPPPKHGGGGGGLDVLLGKKRKTLPSFSSAPVSKYGGLVLQCTQPLAHSEYLSKFLTKSQADELYKDCMKHIQWKNIGLNRQSALLGDMSIKYPYGKPLSNKPGDLRYNETTASIFPSLQKVLDRINLLLPNTIPKLDVALCGLYESGKNYLGFHADDEEHKAITPIASLSLGAERYFSICPKGQKDMKATHSRILLEHGSVLMMHSEIHDHFEHALLADNACKQPRINITFRHARQ